MLQGKLIITVLFVFFIGSCAQQRRPNIEGLGAEKDDELVNQQQKLPFQLETQQSVNNAKSSVDNVDNNNFRQPRPRIVQPSSSNQAQSPSLPLSTSLSTSVECKVDIQRYCGKGGSRPIPNLQALQCIDDLDNAVYLISKECQHTIYKYKYNMTHDARFDDAALRFCRKDIKILDDCNEHADERGTGRLISCLYESLSNITEVDCRNFIKHMQSMIFTDWRLSEAFTEACKSDIDKLECGQIDDENQLLVLNQGAVLACLSGKHESLSKFCLKHVSLFTEMQSDDYTLDRALYHACRDDRERLCSQVDNNNGRVYRCLYEEKRNIMMTQACRKEVHRRQLLVVVNVKVDAPLIRACSSALREHLCSFDMDDSNKPSSLVRLLLCLQERVKKGYYIENECQREMLVHRRMLTTDYILSPEIVSKCKAEMVQFCPSSLRYRASEAIDSGENQMFHCLLSAARLGNKFSSECLSSIKTLVRAVDPGNDIRADPLLETTCQPVIDALCSRIKPGDSNIIMCLLQNIKTTRMTEECENRLMEVSYFILQDWRLAPRFMLTCRNKLLELCQFQGYWSMDNEVSDSEIGTYLDCLYRRQEYLDSECRSELKPLMYIRSISIDLMPEIQKNCMVDLATCRNPVIKGEGMACLQRKYDYLENQCKAAVRNFTKITMSDPTLDFPMMKACESMIQSFCPNIESRNEDDLLRCLVKYKNNLKMDNRCKAAIGHHQITSMKDTAFFSQSFQYRCGTEINEHCQAKQTKSTAIQCLADLMLRDILRKENRIYESCRDGLKFELLQRGESINFDSELAQACESDIRSFCGSKLLHDAEVLDCLKTYRNRVSISCYRRLKRREQIDVVAPESDYSLTTKCSEVIQRFCPNENKQNILSCLRRNANQEILPNTCRNVLYHRLMILNSDARFNKALIESCDTDIRKYCANEVIYDDDDDDDQKNQLNDSDVKDRDMSSQVIGCLRTKYANKNADLEPKCITELVDLIQTSKLHVQLDVKLYQKCQNILDIKCTGGDQEDCLKLLYQKDEIIDSDCKKQVERIIKEEQLYLNADHLLYAACQVDILKFCYDIPIGSIKQLQCLLNNRILLSRQCQNILLKREGIWNIVDPSIELNPIRGVSSEEYILFSNTLPYIAYCGIFVMLVVMFMAGYVYRAHNEYNRIIEYE